MRMRLPLFLVVTTLVAVAASSAPPSSNAQALAALDQARAAVGKLDWANAVTSLSQALATARLQAPLTITAAEVVTGAHVGVGVYDKAVDGVVSNKRLRLYVEVENLTATPLSPGRFRHEVDVVGRFFVVDGTNLEPLGEKNLGRQTVDAWRALPVHAVGVDLTLGDAPAGPYVVEVVVTDVASGKAAPRRVPFTLR
jgi:hypothetical protein